MAAYLVAVVVAVSFLVSERTERRNHGLATLSCV